MYVFLHYLLKNCEIRKAELKREFCLKRRLFSTIAWLHSIHDDFHLRGTCKDGADPIVAGAVCHKLHLYNGHRNHQGGKTD